ncbi:glycine oxidase ThiO [Bacillus sp. AK031]
MNKKYDLIVVGGGIIGSSIAFQQTKLGRKVLILDKNKLSSEASSAAAGMLGAQAEIDENLAMLKLALKSRRMFPTLIQELEELTGIHIGLVNKGMIKVAQNEKEITLLQEQVQFHREWDSGVRWLDGHTLKQHEPFLSSHLSGGMLIPNDGQLQAPQLSQAFAKAAMAKGADVIEFCEVEKLLYNQLSVEGVKTSVGTFTAANVAVTSGAWAGKLLEETGISLDIYPVKGECFSVIPSRPLINATIFSDQGCYIVPKRDGRMIIGATSCLNSFDKNVSLKGISALSKKALSLVPDIGNASWEKAWAGIRPQTGDGLPYIGIHPSIEGLYIAAGHYRNGILLSPITGKIVSDLIENSVTDEESKLYEAFRVNRTNQRISTS